MSKIVISNKFYGQLRKAYSYNNNNTLCHDLQAMWVSTAVKWGRFLLVVQSDYNISLYNKFKISNSTDPTAPTENEPDTI